MKAIWVVRWRGFDEECTNPQEAMDRRDQLEARGIEAEVHEVVGGWRRRVRWPADEGPVATPPSRRQALAAPTWRL
jgi:hypothetical protein